MARKKVYGVTEHKEKDCEPIKYKSALYIRLSREDGDKAQSDSVVNQQKILKSFVEDSEDLSKYEVFIDDNYTGTNFNRPSFIKMIKQLESGNINCIIVKDLSRFAREYIGAGHYIENVFPKYNCRFISVIDGIDTHINPKTATGLAMRVKLIFNDFTSQKTSESVRATKDWQRKQGLWIAPITPYGYLKNPENKHQLIIDEQVRSIVENIFDWYIGGMGIIRITQKLNDLGIMSPSQYRKTKNIYSSDISINASTNWNVTTVRHILGSKVYIGTVDQRKSTTRNYKDRKRIYLDEKDYFIVPNMHEPIIDKSTFETVQKILKTMCTKTSRNEVTLYPLSGFLKCADCHYAMGRSHKFARGKNYVYYKCRANNQGHRHLCNHNHSIREEKVIKCIIESINTQIQTLIDVKRLILYINNQKNEKRKLLDFDKLIKTKEKAIENSKEIRYKAFARWSNKTISKEEYEYAKEKCNKNIEDFKKEIEAIKYEKESYEDIQNNKLDWVDYIISLGKVKELTWTLMTNLVKTVYIHKDQSITIVFKFKDEFERLSQYILDNGMYYGRVDNV